MIEFFSTVVNGFSDVISKIGEIWANIRGVFSDVDFTILYDWMPADIQGVITALLVVLFILALFGILRRVLFFLG